MKDKVHRLAASLAKSQKTVKIAETEVGRLRDELQHYYDRETSVCA